MDAQSPGRWETRAATGPATHARLGAMGEKDIVSKRIVRHLAVDLATYLLKLDIDPDSLELLETESQRVEDRRADLVARVRPRGSDEPFVLHIEIQNNNDRDMAWRMLRYLSDIRLAYRDTRVHQHLIYIGKERLAMPAGLDEADIRYGYGLLDMRQVDCADLIARDDPDALVLAVLCDFRDREPRAVVRHIFGRLRSLLGENPKRLREYLGMLEVLSENRDLRDYIKEAEVMLTQVDVEKLPSYELGMEKGMEKGAHLERRRLAKSLLDLLPDHVVADKTGLPLEDIRGLRSSED